MADGPDILRRRMAAHDALVKMAKCPDLTAAGLSLRLCIGPASAEDAKFVDIEVVNNLESIMELLVDSHRESVKYWNNAVTNERDAANKALSEYDTWRQKHPR